MSFTLPPALRPIRLLVIGLAALALAGCQDVGGGGPLINTRASVPVALLVPQGSQDPNNEILATSLTNAARMAVDDLSGARIDLRVYPTEGTAQGAANAASKAANEGARIILGPVYADAANAAGRAVGARGLTVLSFSNNPQIAGGNVFILGNTFRNNANRLVRYAMSQGYDRIMVVHADNLTGQVGRAAVEGAVNAAGATFTGAAAYKFTQQGVIDAVKEIAAQVKDTDTNAIIFAADTAGALPILAQLLPENGVDPRKIKFMGLTRWDIPTQTLSLRGLQGGWFTLPDPALDAAFRQRYAQAYGKPPHPLASLAYDAVAAVGALVATGRPDALSRRNLTQSSGFAGVGGVFRLLPDGTNERALAVVEIRNRKVQVIDPAPTGFDTTGF